MNIFLRLTLFLLLLAVVFGCSKSPNIYEIALESPGSEIASLAPDSTMPGVKQIAPAPTAERKDCLMPIAPQGGYKQFIILKEIGRAHV